MALNFVPQLPEPGDDMIRFEDVTYWINEYESAEEDEHGEVQAPFSAEVYQQLKDFADEASHCEEAIHRSHFVEYIRQLIDECYEIPKNNGQWPYCHLTMDYEAAAKAAEVDYVEIEFGGEWYLCR